jgi:hypothetical protein
LPWPLTDATFGATTSQNTPPVNENSILTCWTPASEDQAIRRRLWAGIDSPPLGLYTLTAPRHSPAGQATRSST